MNNGSSPPPSARASRIRYTILGLLCLLAMITYLDRAVIARAKEPLMRSVGAEVGDFYMLLVAVQLA
jgi:hypothetical protein